MLILYRIILITFLICQFSFAQPIYFVENNNSQLNSSNILGGNISLLSSDTPGGYYGIAADYKNQKLYLTYAFQDKIFRMNFDGSDKTLILDNSDGIDGPRGITIDHVNDKIYWVESISCKLKSADLDGSNIVEIHTRYGSPYLLSPVDVALDLENNKLYWSDNGNGKKKISRSNLDGSNIEDIVTDIEQVGGIDIDVESGKLFWVDFGYPESIMCSNLDGTNIEIVTSINPGSIFESLRDVSFDRYSKKLFYSSVKDSSITKMDLDGSNKLRILTGLNNPIGIATHNPSTKPVTAQIKIMLEGSYNSSTYLMSDVINTNIPLQSVYEENSRIIETMPADIVDWVLVELRESMNGPAKASYSALLRTDGRIVSDDGLSDTIKISADPGDYYIVVKHRNHLSIMSSDVVTLTK